MNQRLIPLLILFGQLVAVLQKPKVRRLIPDHGAHGRSRRLKGQTVHTFQAEEDHRKLPLVLLAQLFFLCDFEAVEQGFVCADLKKALQHTHVQRLAEAAGTGEEVHFAPVAQKFADESCLIDVIEVVLPYLFKTVDADRKLLHPAHSPLKRFSTSTLP